MLKWRCTQLEMCFEGPTHSWNMCIWRNAQNTQVVCSLAFPHVLHSMIITYCRLESLLNKTNQQISDYNMCRGKLHVAYRLLRSRVRITLREYLFVTCICTNSSLCDELISRSEELYWVCLIVCDLKTLQMRRPRPDLGCFAPGIYIYIYIQSNL